MKKYNIEDDGFEIVENALPAEGFNLEFDKLIQSFINQSLLCDIFMTEFGPKQIQNLHKRFYGIGELAEKVFILSKLKGDFKILNSQLFIKYPNYKITAPHQDGAYFNNPERKIYTFWIPLQDVTVENSCMYYVPKSHFNGLREHKQIGSTLRTRTGNTGYSLTCEDFELDSFIPVPLKGGDFVFHDQLTVHYSSMNKTEDKRIALTIIIEII